MKNNLNNIDEYKGNIFFCDSPFIAIIISELINSENNNLIVLESKDFESNNANIQIMQLILKLKVDIQIILNVPQPWNLIFRSNPLKTLTKLREFKNSIIEKFKFPKDAVYYGAVTSSLMMCSPVKNRIYIDHGFIEPIRRISKISKKGMKINFFRTLALFLHKTVDIPPFDIEENRIGYSSCKLKDDKFKHINLEKYEISNELYSLLLPLINKINYNQKVVVGLMSSDWHSGNTFPSYREIYDEKNLNLIKRQCNKTDIIFVKFHRQLFVNGFNSVNFTDYCRNNGYEVIDIDQLLPEQFQGIIPVEILIKPLGIKKIFAEVSGALINLSHIDDLEVTMDYSDFSLLRSKTEQGFIKQFIRLNEHLHIPFKIKNNIEVAQVDLTPDLHTA